MPVRVFFEVGRRGRESLAGGATHNKQGGDHDKNLLTHKAKISLNAFKQGFSGV